MIPGSLCLQRMTLQHVRPGTIDAYSTFAFFLFAVGIVIFALHGVADQPTPFDVGDRLALTASCFAWSVGFVTLAVGRRMRVRDLRKRSGGAENGIAPDPKRSPRSKSLPIR